jgi:hypothetical protein
MATAPRDRITVDLKGAGRRLHECASSHGLTVAAFARRALLLSAQEPPDPASVQTRRSASCVKVTLRLPAEQARVLADRAGMADVSQGSYVAELLKGAPPIHTSADLRDALRALAQSCDLLSTISTDLNSIVRGMQRSGSASAHLARINALDADLRRHLVLASTTLAEISPPRASPSPEGRKWRLRR